MTLKTHCTPRQSVFDRNRRDIVLDLSDFLEGKIEGERFFEENFITSGMKTLLVLTAGTGYLCKSAHCPLATWYETMYRSL